VLKRRLRRYAIKHRILVARRSLSIERERM